MALVKCPECGANVSSAALTCIHCGYPLQGIAAQPPPHQPISSPPISQESQSSVGRSIAGVSGVLIVLVVLAASAAVDPEGSFIFAISAGGVAASMLVLAFIGHGGSRSWRWYHRLPAAMVGAVAALLLVVAVNNPGDSQAVGFALGAGASYGLILGVAASLLVYAVRPKPERRGGGL
jgi:hypothetical protein